MTIVGGIYGIGIENEQENEINICLLLCDGLLKAYKLI